MQEQFISTPIYANREKDAREILGRTYTADKFVLKRYAKVNPGRRYAWQFKVIRRGGSQ